MPALYAAWSKVAGNGGAPGADGVSIAKYAATLHDRVSRLGKTLRSGDYLPGEYRRVDIPKRRGGLRRLMIPNASDRIVHTAIAEALKPVLEPMFEDASFAYRPGRSVKQAVAKIEHWRDRGYTHVIEADIVAFFDNIAHDLLLQKLRIALDGVPGSAPLLEIIADIIDHQGLTLDTLGRGLVQGSPLSPILANLYLDALDEAMDSKGVRIVRFADDFVILCTSFARAEDALDNVARVLAEHGLKLHEDGTQIVSFERGFDFVGHLFVKSLAVKKTYDDDLRMVPLPEAEIDNEQAQTPRYSRGFGVIYMTERGGSIARRNESFSIRNPNDHELAAVHHLRAGRIEVGPGVRVDQDVIEHCITTETDLAFVNGFGETRGQVVRSITENAKLHLAQASVLLTPALRDAFAASLVAARIRNQRTQLFRLNRTKKSPEVSMALKQMARILRKVPDQASLNELRGIEGSAAAQYWPALGQLTKHAPAPFRRARPATDPFNATINYLTAILERDIRAALLGAGLHIGLGILHAPSDRNEAAVYDLMEPFRAPLTEGLAAYLFNANRLRPEMFGGLSDAGCRIHAEGRKAIITGYERAVDKRVNITGGAGKLAWRPLMQRQARDLAKAFRSGDVSDFVPYLMEA